MQSADEVSPFFELRRLQHRRKCQCLIFRDCPLSLAAKIFALQPPLSLQRTNSVWGILNAHDIRMSVGPRRLFLTEFPADIESGGEEERHAQSPGMKEYRRRKAAQKPTFRTQRKTDESVPFLDRRYGRKTRDRGTGFAAVYSVSR